MATSKFQTIHIFGFGMVQVIGNDLNVQCPISDVQLKANACIDDVWSKKPIDSNITNKNYHAINVFDGMFADWQPKTQGENSYRTPYSELSNALFQALAQAVIDAQPTPPTP